VREAAAQALGEVGHADPAQARAALTAAALNDPSQLVCAAACRALTQLPGEAHAAVTELLRGLQQGRPRVQRRAARALASFPDQGAAIVPVLSSALNGSHAAVRRAVAAALGGLGAPAVGALPALIRRLYDRGKAVRVTAVAAARQLMMYLPAPLHTLLRPLLAWDRTAKDHLEYLLQEVAIHRRAVAEEFARTCERRVNWYTKLSGAPVEPSESATLAGEWARRAVAAAAAAALSHPPRRRSPEAAQTAARADEEAWQLACLCRLLCRTWQQPAPESGKAP
jgi:hypothetical protein